MDNICIRHVLTASDCMEFYAAKNEYFTRDIVPDCDLGSALTQDDIQYFQSSEYHNTIEKLCTRNTDRAERVFFEMDNTRIGFCLYCTYMSEDRKCFIIDFCIYPQFRNRGLGKLCFKQLLKETQGAGAELYELNTHCKRALRFWESLGFMYNGYDSHGSILLLMPPKECSISCEELKEEDIWQIMNLENGYKYVIGEPFLSEQQQNKLTCAIQEKHISFYVVKRSTRVIGMCSVSTIFSTFKCTPMAVFEDFYIEPAFRKKGYGKALVDFVQKTCTKKGITSLWVGSSDVDIKMYKQLGFIIPLGTLLCWSKEE